MSVIFSFSPSQTVKENLSYGIVFVFVVDINLIV